MLTTSAAWDAAFLRAHADVRFIVKIDNGSSSWSATDGVCDQITHDVAVSHIDPVSYKLNRSTGKMSVGSINLSVLDAWIRPILSANYIKGAKITVTVGERSLAAGQFEPYFAGVVDEFTPDGRGGIVNLLCLNVLNLVSEQKIAGSWIAEHPLDAAYDILSTRLDGLDSSFINASKFDPSDSDYASVSHIVVNKGQAYLVGMPQITSTGSAEFTPESALGLIEGLFQTIDAALIIDESGQMKPSILDSSASAVGHWEESEIIELRQISNWERIKTRVSVGAGGSSPFLPTDVYTQDNFRHRDFYFVLDDDDNKTNYAGGVITNRVISETIDNPWTVDAQGFIPEWTSGLPASTDPFTNLYVSVLPGFSGTRSFSPPESQPTDAKPLSTIINAQDETDYDGTGSNGTFSGGTGHSVSDVITLADGTDVTVDAVSSGVVTQFTVDATSADGTTPNGVQNLQSSTTGGGSGFLLTPGVANVTEVRPLYWVIRDRYSADYEIVKITTQPEEYAEGVWNYYDPGDGMTQVRVPSVLKATVHRAQFGTTKRAFGPTCLVVDITPAVWMAERHIERYGDANPRVEITTDKTKYKIQIGDIVTFDYRWFLGYGLNGIDSGSKWEVVGKEARLSDDNPVIVWELDLVVSSSPTKSYSVWSNALANSTEQRRLKFLDRDTSRPRIKNGIVVSHDTGLVVSVSGGSISSIEGHHVLDDGGASVTMEASKDSYLYANLGTGGLSVIRVANGSPRPSDTTSMLPLAKVVTNGSTVTGVTDLRVENVDKVGSSTASFPVSWPHGCPNGSFGDW